MSAPNPECPGCQMLLAQVQQLAARVAELEARLEKHSGNSSKPPSSDHPHDPQAHASQTRKAGTAEAPGKRKRGGQPGHPGTTRDLLPLEAVQEVVPCVPTTCAHCQSALPAAPTTAEPAPIREQVWELPPIVWQIREFQRHPRTCPDCGQRTWGQRPADAPAGCLGFRAQAAVAVLTGGAQLTRRSAATLLAELLGLSLSVGTISRVEATVSAALATAEAEVAAAVGAAPVVNCDETPWREPEAKPWLWVATTPEATLFRIDLHRDSAAFAALLPPRPGQVKGTDRYSVYISRIPVEEHAVCWAHLDREFAAWAARPGVAGTIARWLGEEAGKLFTHWHAFKRGEFDRLALQERLAPVQRAVQAALSWGAASGVAKFTGLCRNLLDRWEALWTFARVEGVEPTNNAAERAVRQGVLWRKVSLFTQSERGREYVARLLTVKTSLRQRGGNLLEFLTESLRAQQTGLPAPKLPAPAPA
jgi:transposase